MSLSGCHVVCAYPGSLSYQERTTSILGRPLWSQTLVAGGAASSKGAPVASPVLGDAVFHYRAAVDGYLIIDPVPNASDVSQNRVVAPQGEMLTVYVKSGDKALFVGA